MNNKDYITTTNHGAMVEGHPTTLCLGNTQEEVEQSIEEFCPPYDPTDIIQITRPTVCFHPNCTDSEHNHDVDYGRGGKPMTLPLLIKCLSETTNTIMVDCSGGRIM